MSCMITIVVVVAVALLIVVIGFLWWVGYLDRPRFQVVESMLGSTTLSNNKQKKKNIYALVTTCQDEEYIDNNICKVIYATKRGIDQTIAATRGSHLDESTKTSHQKGNYTATTSSKPAISIASSYLIANNNNNNNNNSEEEPDSNDVLGVTIFLQDPATGERHETAVGFLMEASSFEEVQALAEMVRVNTDDTICGTTSASSASSSIAIASELGSDTADLIDETEISHDSSLSSTSCASSSTMMTPVPVRKNDESCCFFKVKAVCLGNGPVFRGRIPVRTNMTFSLARSLHWGRAYQEYTELMRSDAATKERAVGAVACELYVNGQHNDAIGSVFLDYLYLLNPNDRETVWKQLDTPMP